MNIWDHLYNQDILDREAREEMRAEGKAEGRAEERLFLLSKLMKKSYSAEDAMDFLEIPPDQRAYYAERLAQQNQAPKP